MGVPEFWLVDVVDRVIEVHREPAGDRYGRVETVRAGDELTLVAFPDVIVPVARVLG